MSHGVIQATGEKYRLEFRAGELSFAFKLQEQFWHIDGARFRFLELDTPTIYGDRGRSTGVNVTLANRFLARCVEQGVHDHINSLEVYLLARLAPYMRPNAARNALPDAAGTYFFGSTRKSRNTAVKELADYLRSSVGNSLTLSEFSSRTGKYFTKTYSYPQHLDYLRSKYKLIPPAVLELTARAAEQGADEALANWQAFSKRRHHDPDERAALDALAYEARAAVRRCYADFWREAVDTLRQKNALNEAEYRLHCLMHCELPVNCVSLEYWKSAFHGHIFWLHPAARLLVATPAGARLVKDVIQSTESDGSFERFLYGFNLALHQLAGDHEEYKTSRRKEPRNESSAGNPEDLEARMHQVKKRRRPASDG